MLSWTEFWMCAPASFAQAIRTSCITCPVVIHVQTDTHENENPQAGLTPEPPAQHSRTPKLAHVQVNDAEVAPLTSFDWSLDNAARLVTSSINNSVVLWDIEVRMNVPVRIHVHIAEGCGTVTLQGIKGTH